MRAHRSDQDTAASGRGGWAPDREARLRQLWHAGLSAREIAAELGHGITRNAVLGKVHRDNLPGRHVAGRKPVGGGDVMARTPADVVGAPDLAAPLSAAPEPGPEFRCALLDLGSASCRWPYGDPDAEDFVFCGAPTAPRASYCAHLVALAYREPVMLSEEECRRRWLQMRRINRSRIVGGPGLQAAGDPARQG